MAKNGKPKKQQAPGERFWDRPPLMNLLADALLVFALVTLTYAALIGMQRLPLLPLRALVVTGGLKQVTPMQVEYAARSSLGGNIFTFNPDQVRAAFEKLPWVRRAEVRRRWPDTVEVNIEEHVAAARWRQTNGEYQLVNSFGEVFAAASEADLPIFSGPEGSAAQMLGRQREFVQVLAALGRAPKALDLSPRQAWQVRLDDGLVLQLGRDEPEHSVSARMARFAASYSEVAASLPFRAGLIDMRYPNGFAVRPAHGAGTA